MNFREAFVAYIKSENRDGSNRASSYIRAINLLDSILEQLPDSAHLYEFGTICLTPFLHICSEPPELVLTEHMDSCWIDPVDWRNLKWAPADIPIVEHFLSEVISNV